MLSNIDPSYFYFILFLFFFLFDIIFIMSCPTDCINSTIIECPIKCRHVEWGLKASHWSMNHQTTYKHDLFYNIYLFVILYIY